MTRSRTALAWLALFVAFSRRKSPSSAAFDALAFKKVLNLRIGQTQRPIGPLRVIRVLSLLLAYMTVAWPYHTVLHVLSLLSLRKYRNQAAQLGRPLLPDLLQRTLQYLMARSSIAESRACGAGRGWPHTVSFMHPAFKGMRNYIQPVRVPSIGLTGRWIANPKSSRKEDELVVLMCHGGGFTLDSSGLCQPFWAWLIKEMEARKRRISVFQLDMELAPDCIWPSQIIETLNAYDWILHTVGVRPDRVCLMGDSAGGHIAVTSLLQLARPSPDIKLPAHVNTPLPRPGSVVLVSPYVKLATPAQCDLAHLNHDFIEPRAGICGSLELVGCVDTTWTRYGSWSPLQLVLSPISMAKRDLRRLKGQRRIEQEAKIAKALKQFENPRINPSRVTDLAWLREAFPDRTLVTVGSIEMLAPDIKEFAAQLHKAGVPAQTIEKHGIHDWIMYERAVPGLWRNRSTGPDNSPTWGLKMLASFLELSMLPL